MIISCVPFQRVQHAQSAPFPRKIAYPFVFLWETLGMQSSSVISGTQLPPREKQKIQNIPDIDGDQHIFEGYILFNFFEKENKRFFLFFVFTRQWIWTQN